MIRLARYLVVCGFMACALPSGAWGACTWNGGSNCIGSCTISYQTCTYKSGQTCKCEGVSPNVPVVNPVGMVILTLSLAAAGVWTSRQRRNPVLNHERRRDADIAGP